MCRVSIRKRLCDQDQEAIAPDAKTERREMPGRRGSCWAARTPPAIRVSAPARPDGGDRPVEGPDGHAGDRVEPALADEAPGRAGEPSRPALDDRGLHDVEDAGDLSGR